MRIVDPRLACCDSTSDLTRSHQWLLCMHDSFYVIALTHKGLHVAVLYRIILYSCCTPSCCTPSYLLKRADMWLICALRGPALQAIFRNSTDGIQHDTTSLPVLFMLQVNTTFHTCILQGICMRWDGSPTLLEPPWSVKHHIPPCPPPPPSIPCPPCLKETPAWAPLQWGPLPSLDQPLCPTAVPIAVLCAAAVTCSTSGNNQVTKSAEM